MKFSWFKKILLICAISLSGCQVNANPESMAAPTNSPASTPTEIPTSVPVLQQSTPASNTSNQEQYVFKESDPGFVTLKGYLLVFDPSTTLPDPNDAIFLVPLSGTGGVVTIPPFTVGEVPQAEVDERTGDFVFTNIQPGQYAVVVLTMGQAQMPARFADSGSFAIITLTEADVDQIIVLEKIGIP